MSQNRRRSGADDAPSLAVLLSEASRRASADLERVLDPAGLPVEQWRVLERLADGHGRTMSALAEEVDMKLPSLSKLIDRMVGSALVQRGQDPADQRRVLVYVSDIGLEKHRLLRGRVRRTRQDLETRLGDERGRELRRLLEDFLRHPQR
ncbi:MAG: MarR family transcriptional regulator [Burkholderiales bacterium]|jgi:DNA-binding MarR family transcriptional regulator